MDKKTTDIVAYITFIGWIVAYCTGAKEESKFHLNQGLVIAIGEIALSLLGSIFSGFLGWVVSIAGILLFVIALIAFIGACKGEEKPMPILGSIQILK